MRTWTLAEDEQAVREAWASDTCDPHDVADWSPDNPARGQCGVTALVVQDLIGGHLVLGEVPVAGTRTGAHWWNRLPGGLDVDLTREQFSAKEIVTGGQVVARLDRPADAASSTTGCSKGCSPALASTASQPCVRTAVAQSLVDRHEAPTRARLAEPIRRGRR